MTDTNPQSIIKPITPSGSVSIGNTRVDIETNVVPSSSPPEHENFSTVLEQAIKKNTFKPIGGNEQSSNE